MTQWQGHQRSTSDLLIGLMLRARAGREDFSRAERVLYTACEFWAAARNRSLKQYLAEDPHRVLSAAEECFAAMDLESIAALLRLQRVALANQDSPPKLDQVSNDIEEDLARIGPAVDEKIAQFACEQTWDQIPAYK